jgi:hypothetical protein
MQESERAVRECAYYLWIEGGRKDGDADANWFAAERKIARASASTVPRATPELPKAMNSKTDNDISWILAGIVVVAVCLA